METLLVPAALRELDRLIGHQTALDHFHGALRRAAQSIQPVHGYGMVQVTCSDEFQGEIRSGFERDVARSLMAGAIGGNRTIFQLSNMGGRLEAGALALACRHFESGARDARERLLVVEISSHVGLMSTPRGRSWGRVERFGTVSECCGALAALIEPPAATAAVRHPWFDQLSAFFGKERLEALRADTGPTRMLRAAIVHAVLQSESALADLLREPPSQPMHALVAAAVVVNQTGQDEVVPCGVHHVRSDGKELALLHGSSLRSTPAALRFQDSGGRVHVTCDDSQETAGERRAQPALPHEFAAAVRDLHAATDDAGKRRAAQLRAELQRTRSRVAELARHPQGLRVYARPLLRSLIQRLSLIAPRAGIAALLAECASDPERAAQLRALLQKGLSSEDARKLLHDFEADLQQLGHRDAQAVLAALLEHAPSDSAEKK